MVENKTIGVFRNYLERKEDVAFAFLFVSSVRATFGKKEI